MSNVVTLPLSDRWLFTADVFRRPDGVLVARLGDISASEIDAESDVGRALAALAGALRTAADGMEQEARMIG